MPLEIIYLFAIALLLIIGIVYLFLRIRKRRNPTAAATTNRDLFAWLVITITNLVKRIRQQLDSASLEETESVSLEQLRFPVSALLAGGVLLVWMGQTVLDVMPTTERKWVILLMIIGGIGFLVAGQTAVRQKPIRWLVPPVRMVCRYLQIEVGQFLFLLMAPAFAWMASLAAGDILQARHGFISILAWIIALNLVIIGSLKFSDERGLHINRPEILYTSLLFFAAVLIRGLGTAVLPTTFSGDEGSAGLSALLFYEGKADNLFGIGWFSFPSFYFAVQSLGIFIWGRTIEGLRVLSAIAGAMAVVSTYWLARSLFDRKTAVIASLYLATSHYHMHISRIGLNNIWDSLFGTITLLGFWHGWKTGKRVWFVLCGLALGLGQYFYVSIRVMPLLLLLWAAAAFWRDRDTFFQRLPGLITAAFIAFIVYLPLGIFFLKHPLEFNAPLERVSILGPRLQAEVLYRGQTAVSILAEQARLAIMGFTQEPLRLLYNPGAPLLLTGAATLFLLGIAWSITHFDLRYLLMFLPLVGAILSNVISQDPPASQRFVMAMPLVAIFVAVPLGEMGNWVDRLWPRVKHIGLVITAVIIATVMAQDIQYYFGEVYDSYVLGGINTQVASEIADYFQEQVPSDQDVFFFGAPRMGYYSLSTIPFLAPDMRGQDVLQPLQAEPTWNLEGATLFVFLPERVNELEFVKAAYPDGTYREFHEGEALFLFASYEVK
ncbi:MAG: hypothetical protein GY943_31865 [Chloroflexi bacterium]|nr:hypothetical protein [Chloroflexota bacterium]